MEKQQFNVYLPPDLIRRVKHGAIDGDASLSTFVQTALERVLSGEERSPEIMAAERPISPLPIIYVSDMKRSLEFYKALGFVSRNEGRIWSELRIGAAGLALHHIDTDVSGPQRMGLAMTAHSSLEEIQKSLRESGIEVNTEIADEAFGRSLTILDPDGLAIQINEHDPEFYS